MGIIWTILIGFVVGLLAKMLMPSNDGYIAAHGWINWSLVSLRAWRGKI